MYFENLEAKIIQISKDAYDLNNPNKLVDFFLEQTENDIRALFYHTKSPILPAVAASAEWGVPKLQYVAFLMLYYYYNCHSDKIVWEDADGNVEDIEMNVGFVSMKNYWSNIAFYGLDLDPIDMIA
jgi:hypothetical protein